MILPGLAAECVQAFVLLSAGSFGDSGITHVSCCMWSACGGLPGSEAANRTNSAIMLARNVRLISDHLSECMAGTQLTCKSALKRCVLSNGTFEALVKRHYIPTAGAGKLCQVGLHLVSLIQAIVIRPRTESKRVVKRKPR